MFQTVRPSLLKCDYLPPIPRPALCYLKIISRLMVLTFHLATIKRASIEDSQEIMFCCYCHHCFYRTQNVPVGPGTSDVIGAVYRLRWSTYAKLCDLFFFFSGGGGGGSSGVVWSLGWDEVRCLKCSRTKEEVS